MLVFTQITSLDRHYESFMFCYYMMSTEHANMNPLLHCSVLVCLDNEDKTVIPAHQLSNQQIGSKTGKQKEKSVCSAKSSILVL